MWKHFILILDRKIAELQKTVVEISEKNCACRKQFLTNDEHLMQKLDHLQIDEASEIQNLKLILKEKGTLI